MSHPGYEPPDAAVPSVGQPADGGATPPPPPASEPWSAPPAYTPAPPEPVSPPAPSTYAPDPTPTPTPTYTPQIPAQYAPPAPSGPAAPPPAGAQAVPVGAPADPPGPPAYSPGPPAYPPGAAPVPGPPTYDTAAAQPYSATPYSAPPVSGAYGYPMSVVPVAPPPKRRGTVVLAVLTALFLVAAGIFGALFFVRNSEASDLTAKNAQLTSDVTTQTNRADGLQKDLDNTKRDLTDAKADAAEIDKARQALADCLNAFEALSAALSKSGGATNADVRAKQDDLVKKCSAADKFLAPR